MENFEDVLIENDKTNCPFLLAASFNGLIKFAGSYTKDGILYWQFSPKDKAQILIDQFNTRTAPSLQPKDLFEAIDTFWKQVEQARNGEINYGEKD